MLASRADTAKATLRPAWLPIVSLFFMLDIECVLRALVIRSVRLDPARVRQLATDKALQRVAWTRGTRGRPGITAGVRTRPTP
jgi:hypothetical protein